MAGVDSGLITWGAGELSLIVPTYSEKLKWKFLETLFSVSVDVTLFLIYLVISLSAANSESIVYAPVKIDGYSRFPVTYSAVNSTLQNT